MKPAPFVHHAPRTVAEAVTALAEVGHDGKVLAGGQSLIPILNMRLASPAHLVDINQVAGLDEVTVTDAEVRVGALVRHAQLEHSDEAYVALPLLRQALVNVAHPVIRNRGTTVGSIAHADAAGEMPAMLALTGGVVEAASSSGTREIAVADFFQGALETSLAADELAVAVRFRRFAAGTGTAFMERARRHGDYAMAGVAAAVRVDDGVVADALLSFVSVTDVPTTLDVTDAFAGQEPGAADWSTAADLVRDAIEPDGDIHATAAYRAMLAVELSRLTLAQAAAASLSHAKGDLPTGGASVSHAKGDLPTGGASVTRLVHESPPGGVA
ncbi:carbon-monoxide dehydrogenase medium subunit [Pedococcus dokdonensis]|uniref:Carbon-monoxide dehydrogenase medium subunit n=1 Tax=Pedococcus dokdonensis TaxID=443156 RepID=A0A1H0RRJ2_9MICO|nr:FAD binding domain-containing protein [Pedococcus dokdonensis]SDP32171.1 carbon-monoxide dehydrogenase medium subunit [Pedococcus dokdonensis]